MVASHKTFCNDCADITLHEDGQCVRWRRHGIPTEYQLERYEEDSAMALDWAMRRIKEADNG